MKGVYPVFIAESGKDYLVYVPDMDINTEGTSLGNAMEMARDAIGLKGIDLEDDGKELPVASDYAGALEKAKKAGINFSRLLQDALIARLNIGKR